MNESVAESASIKSARTGRVAGGVLLASSLSTIVAMAHHPTGHGSGGTGGITLGGFIHASMIVLLAANLWGLIVFSVRRHFDGWMLAGIVAYAIGFVGHVLAATINGFIVPAVFTVVDHANSADLFAMLWQSNQAFATLGVYATSAAFVVWSVSLIGRKSVADSAVGVLGLLAAAVPSLTLLAGIITLNVDGALIVYGVHAAWIGVVGIQMLRRAL